MDTRLNRGMAVDVRVGESITLQPAGCPHPIVVHVEHKQGQRSRLRVQSSASVKVTRDTTHEKVSN